MEASRVFLVHFLKKWKYLDFCLPELEALAEMNGVKLADLYHEKTPKDQIDIKKAPYVYVNLPNELVAQRIQGRSILIKEIINVLSESKNSYEDLVKAVDLQALQKVIDKKEKFRFFVETVGKKVSSQRQRQVIEMFNELPFDAPLVDLNNYTLSYIVLENAADGSIFFGETVASCRPPGADDDTFYSKYNLKLRPYLGPTSTDHELALLMANQGQVSPGDFVYDPFVGTGSIATALQHFGAFVFGSDLDIRVIKGYGVGRKTRNKVEGLEKIEKFDITTNFKHYGLPLPDFWVQDMNTPMLATNRQLFDAIVCDPPYGVRARTHTVGVSDSKQKRYQQRKAKEVAKQDEDKDENGEQNQIQEIEQEEEKQIEEQVSSSDADNFHASMKKQYSQKAIYFDLMDHASRQLRPGGLLVFLFHTDDEHTEEENRFPEHAEFIFLRSSKDGLTKTRARHLITMKRK